MATHCSEQRGLIYEDVRTVLRTSEKVYQVGREMLLFLAKRWRGVFSVDAVLIRSNPEIAPGPAIIARCHDESAQTQSRAVQKSKIQVE